MVFYAHNIFDGVPKITYDLFKFWNMTISIKDEKNKDHFKKLHISCDSILI